MKIQQLLARGREHYAAGRYEQAIHVWTRVLLLDRDHPEAHASIERARMAIAERQRASEELLHAATLALERGEMREARALLTRAVCQGGVHHDAVACLDRLDKLEAAARPCDPARQRPLLPLAAADHARERRGPAGLAPGLLAAFVAIVVATGGMYAAAVRWRIADELFPHTRVSASTAGPVELRLHRAPTSEVMMGRARLLLARGQLHESLRALDAVKPGDALGPEADLLRRLINTALNSSSPRRPPATGASVR